MRRKDREVTDKSEIKAILNEAQVCRLAMVDNGQPYVVPMNFGYRDGKLYLHSAKEGKKIDILKSNNSVCFEVDTNHKLVTGEQACNWSYGYSSVIGFGKASFIEDEAEKINGLDAIMEKYSGISKHSYSDMQVSRICIIQVEIESMTGKSNKR